jgi:cell division protein ZapA
MSEVTLTIAGRKYTVACAVGEEAHITKLAESIDAKLKQMGNLAAPGSQNMLFAALLLADELHEARSAIPGTPEKDDNLIKERDALAAQVKDLQEALADKASGQEATKSLEESPDMAPALERFADLLENCADKLEGKAATS